MITMFLTNFKALVKPKEFVNLAYRRVGKMVGYTFLTILLVFLLCTVLPMQIEKVNVVTDLTDIMDSSIPEFELQENGKLTIDDGKHFSIVAEGKFVWYDTSVTHLSIDEKSEEFVGNYITDQEALQTENCNQLMFFSQDNLVNFQNGKWTEFSWADLMRGLNITSFSKADLYEHIPGWYQFILTVGYVFIYLGDLINVFFMGLIWGLVGLIMNAILKGYYSYGYLYRMAVYIQLPMLAVRQLLLNLSPLNGGSVAWICRGFIVLYVCVALFHKINTDGPFKAKKLEYRYTPDGPVLGEFDTDFNSVDPNGYTQTTSNGYNPSLSFNVNGYQANSYNANAYNANANGYQANANPVYNQPPVYNQAPVYNPNAEQQQHTNTSYNPNPAYSSNQSFQQPAENTYQPNNRMYSKEELNQMHAKPETKEEKNTPEFAQDPSFAAQTPVWKPQTPENTGMLDEPAFTSQEWKPQAQFDYRGEKQKWNETAPKWNTNQKTSFSQEWNPQKPAKKEDDLFLNGQNEWKSETQVWNGRVSADKSNPTMNHAANQTAQQNPNQWNQSPVWGKKDDGLN